MRSLHGLLLAALLLPAPAIAAFEDLGAGARGPGMGDAFTAVADDVYAIHYNPAGLGTLERPQMGAAYSSLFMGLGDRSSLGSSFVGYAHPVDEGRRGTLAGAWDSFSLNNSLYREQTFTLAYGRQALLSGGGGELFAGAGLKYLQRSFGDFPEASNAVASGGLGLTGRADPVLSGRKSRGAFDADLGLLYKFARHYSLGLMARHLPQPDVAFSEADSDRLPVGIKAGFNYRSLVSNLVAEVDSVRSPAGSRDNTFTAAAERWLPKLFVGEFGLRGAVSVGSRDLAQISLGLSCRTRRMTLDYGFGIPLRTVSGTAGSHRFAVGFRFGRPSDEEESLEMVLEAMRQLKSGFTPVLVQASGEGLAPGKKIMLEEYLNQVRYHEAAGRFREAAERMSAAMGIAPSDEALLRHFSRLNFVVQQCPDLPDSRTNAAQALLHKGAMAFLAGENMQAVGFVSDAQRMDPKNPRLDSFLSELERVSGIKRMVADSRPRQDFQAASLQTQAEAALAERSYDKAIEFAVKAVSEDPGNPAVWETLGTAYFALKEFDKSLDAWGKAFSLESSPAVRESIKDYIRRITLLVRKDERPAVRGAKAAPRLAPLASPKPVQPKLSGEEVQLIYRQGVDHYTQREYIKAKSMFEKILKDYPDNVEAQNALRRVLQEIP
jgi:tetratricopeptide (TPR) repeat protein